MQTEDQGTIIVFMPETVAEYEWLDTCVDYESYQRQGDNLAVDRRMAQDIIDQAQAAGFEVGKRKRSRRRERA